MSRKKIAAASVVILSMLLAGFSEADQQKAEQLATTARDGFWNCLRDRVHSALASKVSAEDFGFFLQRACVSERDSFRSATIAYRRLVAPPDVTLAATTADTDRSISEAEAAAVGAVSQSRKH
jgi:hypothetical protein